MSRGAEFRTRLSRFWFSPVTLANLLHSYGFKLCPCGYCHHFCSIAIFGHSPPSSLLYQNRIPRKNSPCACCPVEVLMGLPCCPATPKPAIVTCHWAFHLQPFIGKCLPGAKVSLWILEPHWVEKEISFSSPQAVSGSPAVPTPLVSLYQNAYCCRGVCSLILPTYHLHNQIAGWEYWGLLSVSHGKYRLMEWALNQWGCLEFSSGSIQNSFTNLN